jgi:tRNA threonylcarbamoyladenosine modification (KEOPS) complex  Pcc1 subunit
VAGSTSTTRAQENKKIRQEALREQLSQGKHVEHVIDIADKLADVEIKLEAQDASRLKAAADIKLKLINKYLPDLKAVEVTRDDEDESPALEVHFHVKEAVSDIKTTNANS